MVKFSTTRPVDLPGNTGRTKVRIERPAPGLDPFPEPRKVVLSPAQRSAFALVAAVDELRASRAWDPEWTAPYARLSSQTNLTPGGIGGGMFYVHSTPARSLETEGFVRVIGRTLNQTRISEVAVLTPLGQELARVMDADVAAVGLRPAAGVAS